MVGITRQAINEVVRSGKIPLVGEGRGSKVDLDNEVVKKYITETKERHKSENGLETERVVHDETVEAGRELVKLLLTKSKPGMSDIPLPGNHKPINPDPSDRSSFGVEGKFTKTEMEIKKMDIQIQQMKVKTDKDRNELISRELLKRVFSKLYAVDQNEFKTLSDKITPEIAAIAQVSDMKKQNQINELIQDECGKILKHIKRILNDFLVEQKAGKIEVEV